MWSELCQLQSGGAGRHTLTRPPPCTLYFPPFCPRPHTLQPATGHMVGGRTVNTNTRKIHSNTQLSARTASLLTNMEGVRKILDTLSRYLDRHQERCIVTAGPGSTAGGGQADSHGPRSSLVEAAAWMNHLATPHNTHCPENYVQYYTLHNLQLANNQIRVQSIQCMILTVQTCIHFLRSQHFLVNKS